jgi:hypothetical protein
MVGAIIGGVASIAGGIIGSSRARRAAKRAARQARKLEGKLRKLEANRQAIIDPYSNVTDLSSMIKNPFTQLGVATKAAEIKIEQADISLANTLDTLRATGAGAGGATALANAALKSKQGVSASIESQEAQNEKMRAQGEQQMEQAQVAQQARLQDIQISEGGRAQMAQAQGKTIEMQMTENREQDQIDYVRGQLEAARQDQAKAQADATSATMGAIGGLGQLAAGSGIFGGGD